MSMSNPPHFPRMFFSIQYKCHFSRTVQMTWGCKISNKYHPQTFISKQYPACLVLKSCRICMLSQSAINRSFHDNFREKDAHTVYFILYIGEFPHSEHGEEDISPCTLRNSLLPHFLHSNQSLWNITVGIIFWFLFCFFIFSFPFSMIIKLWLYHIK